MLSDAFYSTKASRIKLYFNTSYYYYNKVGLGSFTYKSLSIPLGRAKLLPKGGYLIGCPFCLESYPWPNESNNFSSSEQLSLIPTLINKFRTPSLCNDKQIKEDIIIFNLFLNKRNSKEIHDRLTDLNIRDKSHTVHSEYIKGTSIFICLTLNVSEGCIVYPYNLDNPARLPLEECSYLSHIYDLITVDIQPEQVEELNVISSKELIMSQEFLLEEYSGNTPKREKLSNLIKAL